ncbi:Exportin-6 [Lobulomyces angularis]|nr:Exportin-6 [Lobulomyces angularis]
MSGEPQNFKRKRDFDNLSEPDSLNNKRNQHELVRAKFVFPADNFPYRIPTSIPNSIFQNEFCFDDINSKVSALIWHHLTRETVGTLEIEAKLGLIVHKNTERRVNYPVLTETALMDDGSFKFVSDMTLDQHRYFNELLNKTVAKVNTQTQQKIHYNHKKTVDKVFEFQNKKIRASFDLVTNELIQNSVITKVRIADLNVFSPNSELDYRISLSLEIPFSDLPLNLNEKLSREKDRISYSIDQCQVDLTQIQEKKSNISTIKHEVEVEYRNTEKLFLEKEKWIEGKDKQRFRENVALRLLKYRLHYITSESVKGMDDIWNQLEIYFLDSTSTDRKKVIEAELEAYKNTTNALQAAFQILSTKQSSQYTKWYSLTIFESNVTRWTTLSTHSQSEIKTILWNLTLTEESFIQNKLLKLIVLIAKVEHNPQEYFNTLNSLTSKNINTSLVLLKITLEEFIMGKDDTQKNKQFYRKWLIDQLPFILKLIINVLSSSYKRSILQHGYDSPLQTVHSVLNYGSLEPNSPLKLSNPQVFHVPLLGTSPSKDYSLMTRNFSSNGSILHDGNLDNETLISCQLSLEISMNLLTWIPLNETPQLSNLLELVFQYAQLIDNGLSESLGQLAINCIIELLQRKYVPKESIKFLLSVGQEVNELLRYLMEDEAKLLELDIEYVNKIVLLVGHFISEHIARLETIEKFPLMKFLELFFRFTFKNKLPIEAFIHSLHVWDSFLEYCTVTRRNIAKNSFEFDSRYQEALISLATRLIKSVQVTHNTDALELEYGNTNEADLHEYGHSEWGKFVTPCVELISKITEIYPSVLLDPLFQQFQISYLTIRSIDSGSKTSAKQNNAARDFETLSVVFGRLSHLFIGENFEQNIEVVSELIIRFIEGIKLCLNLQAPTLSFQYLNIHLFGTISLYVHWLAQYYHFSREKVNSHQLCDELVTEITRISLNSLKSENKFFGIAGCSLLCSIASTVKPDYLQLPIMQEFLSVVNQLASQFTFEVIQYLYKFITLIFVLQPFNIRWTQEDWKYRTNIFENFTSQFINNYVELTESKDFRGFAHQTQVKQHISHALGMLNAICASVETANTQAKDVVYHSIRKCLRGTLTLFEVYFHEKVLLATLFEFILITFGSLKKQISREDMNIITDTIGLFLSMLTGENLKIVIERESLFYSNDSLHNGRKVRGVLESFILILKGIVEEPSKSFEAMLPDIIKFCVKDLFHYFKTENPAIENARLVYFQLIFEILFNHWRFFVQSQVFKQVGKHDNSQVDFSERMMQLESLFHIIHQGFENCTTNIELFKQNIAFLLSLDSRCNLFKEEFFKERMMVPFFELFLNIVINKSHDIIKEDIFVLLMRIIEADPSLFKNKFIPLFITKHCPSMQQEQQIILAGYLTDLSVS